MEQPTSVRKPEGGFVFIHVRQLCRAWVAYQQRHIQLVDLWVWFAAHELVARRCQAKAGQPVRYRVEELAHLVGGGHSMAVSLRRLAQAGLLHWDEQRLTFPAEPTNMSDCEALTRMLEQITNRKRRIPIPRRVMRYLAGGCPKVLMATILGHLMRCVYYRKGACHPEGRCKATWIAAVFGVSLRQVKQSRQRLESIGLLERSAVPQWVMNRYGQGMIFNLQWQVPLADSPLHAEQPAPPATGATTRHEAEADGLLRPDPAPSSGTRVPPRQRTSPTSVLPLGAPAVARPNRPPGTALASDAAAPSRAARALHEHLADGSAAGQLTALVQHVQAALRAGQKLDENALRLTPSAAALAPAPKTERHSLAGAEPIGHKANARPTRAPFSLPSVGQILGFPSRGFAATRREDPLAQAPVTTDEPVVREAHAGELSPPASQPATPTEEPPLRPRPTAPVAAALSPTPPVRPSRETTAPATADADRASHEPPAATLPAGYLTALYLQAQAALRAGQKLDENTLRFDPSDSAPDPALREELPSSAVSTPVRHQTETAPAPASAPYAAPLAAVVSQSGKAQAETTAQPQPAPRETVWDSVPDSRPTPPIAAHGASVSSTPAPDSQPQRIAPPCPPKTTRIAPPESDWELSTIEKDQKPAALGSPGVLISLVLHTHTALREGRVLKGEAEHSQASARSAADRSRSREEPASPVVSRTLVNTSPDRPAQAPLPAPTLRHILPQDLRDTGRLLQLYTQAVTAGLSGSAEADRLAFVALAQHVLAYRPKNMGGLFTQLLRKRLFHYATQDNEDSALQRLKRHLHGGTPPILQPVVETALRRAG